MRRGAQSPRARSVAVPCIQISHRKNILSLHDHTRPCPAKESKKVNNFVTSRPTDEQRPFRRGGFRCFPQPMLIRKRYCFRFAALAGITPQHTQTSKGRWRSHVFHKKITSYSTKNQYYKALAVHPEQSTEVKVQVNLRRPSVPCSCPSFPEYVV